VVIRQEHRTFMSACHDQGVFYPEPYTRQRNKGTNPIFLVHKLKVIRPFGHKEVLNDSVLKPLTARQMFHYEIREFRTITVFNYCNFVRWGSNVEQVF
jgi:hypothetical protein